MISASANSTWQNHVCKSRPSRHVNSKQAAPDINHVPILDILRLYGLTANRRLKVKALSALYSVDYASQMNIA